MSTQPSVEPFIFRRYNGSRREYPFPSVPILGESGLRQPRGSSGGTASRFRRLIQQVHQLLSASRSGGLSARLGRTVAASRASEGSPSALPPIISRLFTRDSLRAAGPHHRQHLSHRLSIHAGTLFPPSAQLARRQQSRHRNTSSVTVLFPHRSVLLFFHTQCLLTWRGRRLYTNTAYLFTRTSSSFCFFDLSLDLANS